MRRGSRRLAIAIAAALLALAPASPQVHQGTPYERKIEPPIQGDAFRVPRAVHADPHTGEVFVADTFNNRIVIFDHRGFFRHQISSGEQFRTPTDIAVDDRGFIFTLARYAGQKGLFLLDFDGKVVEKIDLQRLPDGLVEPEVTSVALSTSGDRLFAVDEANKRLWIASRAGEIVSSVDLTAELPPDEAREQIIGHVDVYGETVLIAQPMVGRIELFDLDGRPQTTVGIKGTAPCQMGFPVAAALDADGKLLVLDNQRALFMRWDPETNECLGEYSGFGNVPGALYRPSDMSLDDSGNVYVSQGFEGRVQVFTGPTTAPPLLESLQLLPAGALVSALAEGPERDELLRDLDGLEEANVSQNIELKALQNAYAAVKEENAATRTRLEELEGWHRVIVEALTVRLGEARASQTANETALAAVAGELARSSAHGVELATAVAELEQRQADLQTEAEAVGAEAARFQDEARTEIGALDEAIHQAEVEIVALTTEKEELSAELAALTAEHAAALLAQQELEAELDGIREQHAALEERYAAAVAEIESLTAARGEEVAAAPSLATTEPPAARAQVPREPLEAEEVGAPEPEEAIAANVIAERQTLADTTVRDWAAAWARQQVERYLGFYSADFTTPNGLSRSRWEEQRRDRLSRPSFIEVGIEDLAVEMVSEDTARAVFKQLYRSDRFADVVRKVLELRWEEKRWRIVEEQVIETP